MLLAIEDYYKLSHNYVCITVSMNSLNEQFSKRNRHKENMFKK